MKNKKLNTLDLFAGIGGLRIGFEKAGFETVYANDFDIDCKTTYDNNFHKVDLSLGDIRSIDIDNLPQFGFLIAGFPCQAFSVAGYREGFNDKKGRGDLFFEIAKIIDKRKPEGFLLENVKNLHGHDKGRTYKIISETIKKLGYFKKEAILNTKDYGNLPQNRERIYIVGFRDKNKRDNFEFPPKKKLTKSVADLLENDVDEKYYYNNKALYLRIKDHITNKKKVYQWRRKYVRENKNGVCPTLTANMGMGGHNVPIIKDDKGIRKLTPRECARLQGFADSYHFPESLADSKKYKQIGNSVSVPVVEAIAKQILKVI